LPTTSTKAKVANSKARYSGRRRRRRRRRRRKVYSRRRAQQLKSWRKWQSYRMCSLTIECVL